MIDAFLTDMSLNHKTLGVFTDSEVSSDYGFLSDFMKSYYKTPTHLKDLRSDRIANSNGDVSDFKLHISYDAEMYSGVGSIDLDGLSDANNEKLFNTIEATIYLSDKTDEEIETILTGSSALFGVYVPESLNRSVAIGTVDFYKDAVATRTITEVRHWVSFQFTDGTNTETIKVWVANDSFIEDYPNTYFTKVVYPTDPELLLNGNGQTRLESISDSSAYVFAEVEPTVGQYDNTGLARFESRYIPSGMSVGDNVIFGVLYKGKKPNTQALRDYIREDLLSRNLAVRATWELLLPDLFVDGIYYLIPMWDNFKNLPGVELAQGIINHQKMMNVTKTVLPTFDETFLNEKMEVLLSSASEFYVVGIPDPGNNETFMSLQAEHPTYQPVDARNTHFEHQEEKTKEFNREFAGVMAKLRGAANEGVYTEDEINGRNYLSFVSNYKEFHVLDPDSFPSEY
jgi:hypothetical protein